MMNDDYDVEKRIEELESTFRILNLLKTGESWFGNYKLKFGTKFIILCCIIRIIKAPFIILSLAVTLSLYVITIICDFIFMLIPFSLSKLENKYYLYKGKKLSQHLENKDLKL